MIELPLSPRFALLAAGLPGLWLAGRWFARRVTKARDLAAILTPAFSLSLWLASVHGIGLLASSFPVGLCVGTVGMALFGLAATRWLRGAPLTRGDPISPRAWVFAALATAAIAPAALLWAFHDELYFTGHMYLAAHIQNGGYPPRFPSFPDVEIRYHYGFDLLCAAVGALTRLPLPLALDVVTLSLWGYAACLSWLLGERLLGRGRGVFVAVLLLFGAGHPFACTEPGRPLSHLLLGLCMVDGDMLNPPLVSYFFQHPWTLGLPLALAVFLIASDDAAPPSRWRYSALGLLLSVLSFAQVVLFLCLLPAVAVSEAARCGERRIGRVAVMVLAALALSRGFHGFFAPGVGAHGVGVVFSPLWLRSPALWHLQSFGLLLPIGFVGVFCLRRKRLLVGLLLGGSLLALNLFELRHSWDIVKFATVASIAASILASAVVERLWAETSGRPLAVLTLIGLTAGSGSFLWALAANVEGIPFSREPATYSDVDATVISWLRREVPAGEAVWTWPPLGPAYGQWGGLSQPWMDPVTLVFGVSEERLRQREELIAAMPSDSRAYVAQNIRWFVLYPQDEALRAIVEEWIRLGCAEVRAVFGEVRIARLASSCQLPG